MRRVLLIIMFYLTLLLSCAVLAKASWANESSRPLGSVVRKHSTLPRTEGELQNMTSGFNDESQSPGLITSDDKTKDINPSVPTKLLLETASIDSEGTVVNTKTSVPTKLLLETASIDSEGTVVNTKTSDGATLVSVSVTDAGLSEFDGTYTQVAKQDEELCTQTYTRKDDTTDTEFLIAFLKPRWFLQSVLKGIIKRPYYGADDGTCSPWKAYWQPADPQNEPVPAICNEEVCAPTTPPTTIVIIPTEAPATTTLTDFETAKDDARPGLSRCWLRLYLPLSLWLAIEGLSLKAKEL